MIASPVAITWTPAGGTAIALVAEGDDMVSLPRFEARQDMFDSTGIFLTDAVFKPLGGVRVVITFEVEIERAIGDARNAWMDAGWSGATNLLRGTGTLAIGSVTYSPAAIATLRPVLPPPLPAIRRRYEIRTTLPET